MTKKSAPIPLTGLRRAVTRRTDTRTGLPRENGIGVISGVRGQFTASERYAPERGSASPLPNQPVDWHKADVLGASGNTDYERNFDAFG